MTLAENKMLRDYFIRAAYQTHPLVNSIILAGHSYFIIGLNLDSDVWRLTTLASAG